MNRVSIKLWANKRRVRNDGRISLYLQIVIERKHLEHNLGIDWPSSLYDWENSKLVPRNKKDKEYDDCQIIIHRELSKMWDVVRLFRITEREITLATFYAEFNNGDRRQSFVRYMETMIEQRYRLGKIDSLTRNGQMSSLRALKDFAGNVDFMNVDHRFLEKFTGWLKKRGLADGTLWGRVKHIRTYLNKAKEEGIAINHRHSLYKNPKPPG